MTETKHASGAEARRRDSAATKRALLAAAREVFTRQGYDNAGLRDIAQRAGTDKRLIGRYFGSKENLFAEVVAEAYEKMLLSAPEATHATAVALLSGAEPDNPDGLLLTLRSASSERAAEIMRDSIERTCEAALADALIGPDAVGRAALLLSICAGIHLQRNILHSRSLTNADNTDRLVPYLKAALDAIAATPAAAPAGDSVDQSPQSD
ncbi:TetR family transcriptional regulator [Amycolatopsis sp. NPDC050768]|uniref:TetR/AcrR family transcriptional regulator n=1 Tax=Amycolatopsis sp. NPDC050768 TaxID=3154839 RepID=UPI0033FB1228